MSPPTAEYKRHKNVCCWIYSHWPQWTIPVCCLYPAWLQPCVTGDHYLISASISYFCNEEHGTADQEFRRPDCCQSMMETREWKHYFFTTEHIYTSFHDWSQPFKIEVGVHIFLDYGSPFFFHLCTSKPFRIWTLLCFMYSAMVLVHSTFFAIPSNMCCIFPLL